MYKGHRPETFCNNRLQSVVPVQTSYQSAVGPVHTIASSHLLWVEPTVLIANTTAFPTGCAEGIPLGKPRCYNISRGYASTLFPASQSFSSPLPTVLLYSSPPIYV